MTTINDNYDISVNINEHKLNIYEKNTLYHKNVVNIMIDNTSIEELDVLASIQLDDCNIVCITANNDKIYVCYLTGRMCTIASYSIY